MKSCKLMPHSLYHSLYHLFLFLVKACSFGLLHQINSAKSFSKKSAEGHQQQSYQTLPYCLIDPHFDAYPDILLQYTTCCTFNIASSVPQYCCYLSRLVQIRIRPAYQTFTSWKCRKNKNQKGYYKVEPAICLTNKLNVDQLRNNNDEVNKAIFI